MDSCSLCYVSLSWDNNPIEWVFLDVDVSFFTIGEEINKGCNWCRVTNWVQSTALNTQVSMEELSNRNVIPKLWYDAVDCIIIFNKSLLFLFDLLVDVTSLEVLQLSTSVKERLGCEVSLKQGIVVLPDWVWVWTFLKQLDCWESKFWLNISEQVIHF